MKKSFLMLIAIGALIFGLQAFTTHQQQGFKNLQVLPQNTTRHQIDSIMGHFTRALGVKCGFCHATDKETHRLNFASDEKEEKLIARGMMRMSIDINKTYFAPHDRPRPNSEAVADTSSARFLFSHVTCYTCHHGSPQPQTKPPLLMR